MVGNSQNALELWWAGIQSSLTGGEEVSLTSPLLSDDLHLQICMMLPCSLWSDSAPEALWALTSLMAVEQVASASRIIWSRVILASLTTTGQVVLASKLRQEQVVLESRVTQEQMALASLMDVGLCLEGQARWEADSPHHLVILYEMFQHASEQGWKEVEHMVC